MTTAPRMPNWAALEARLCPTEGAAQALERARLAPPARFRDGAAAVAAVCAPAGYGKSTLLSQWHAGLKAAGMACAWLNVDPGDNDATRYLRHLVSAFQTLAPAVGQTALALLGTPGANGPGAALEALAADLSHLPERTVLFLDDLHF